MAVFRVNKTKDYTVMSNRHLRDKKLTLKAKGLMSQMLSLPDDWDYTLNGLIFLNREKLGAIKAALTELKKAGYLTVTKYQNAESGLFEYRYDIFENPEQKSDPDAVNPAMENPAMENPYMDNPAMENRTLNKIRNSQNTEKRNTERRKTETNKGGLEKIIEESTGNEELRGTLSEFLQFRKDIKKPMKEHALKLLIGKLQKMGRTDAERVEILNQSIVNGWTGIYEVKKDEQRRADTDRGVTSPSHRTANGGNYV